MRLFRKAFAIIAAMALVSSFAAINASAEDVVYQNNFDSGVIDVDDMKNDGHAVIGEENGNKFLSLTTNSTVEGEAGYLQTAIGPDDLTSFNWSMKIRPDKYNTDTWNWIKVFTRSNRTENESYHIELWAWRTCLSVKSAASNKSEDAKLVENDQVTAPAGKWYTLEVFGRGSVVSAYLDGQKIGEITDTLFASGACGFCTWGADISLDDIVITRAGDADPVNPVGKPSTSSKPPETASSAPAATTPTEAPTAAAPVEETQPKAETASTTSTTAKNEKTGGTTTTKASSMTAAQIIMIIASAAVILLAATGEYLLVWRALDYKKHMPAKAAEDTDGEEVTETTDETE